MKFKTCRFLLFTCASILIFAGCKKNSGGPGTDPGKDSTALPEFYLTAKVNGNDWSANIKSDNNNNVEGGISGQFLLVVGAQIKDKDTTAIILAFPKNPTFNTTKNFDPLQFSVAGYGTTIASYSCDPAVNGSGTYSITSKNDSSRVVEGSFSFKGMLLKGTGANSVNVTDGKFKTTYRDNFSPQPPSNLKK